MTLEKESKGISCETASVSKQDLGCEAVPIDES